MVIKYSPYEILGLESNATEEQIKRRYKELIREYSPEHEPERFIAVREAFESLKKTNLDKVEDHPLYRKPLTWFEESINQQIKTANVEPGPLATVFETPYNTFAEMRNLVRKVKRDW
jgi:curved DNA-binding protein CbpA